MKLFYDAKGNVVGSFEGASQEIEDSVGIPSNAASVIEAPAEIAERVIDPKDPLVPSDLQVVNDEVVII